MVVLNEEQIENEAADIRNIADWPHVVFLPVKNLNDSGFTNDRLGIVVVEDFEPFRIYRGVNMFDLEAGPLRAQLERKCVEVLEFESVEAGVKEGWVGD